MCVRPGLAVAHAAGRIPSTGTLALLFSRGQDQEMSRVPLLRRFRARPRRDDPPITDPWADDRWARIVQPSGPPEPPPLRWRASDHGERRNGSSVRREEVDIARGDLPRALPHSDIPAALGDGDASAATLTPKKHDQSSRRARRRWLVGLVVTALLAFTGGLFFPREWLPSDLATDLPSSCANTIAKTRDLAAHPRATAADRAELRDLVDERPDCFSDADRDAFR